MEKNCSQDSLYVSCHCLCNFLCVKCTNLGPEVFWGCAIWYNVCSCFLMVLHLSSTCVSWWSFCWRKIIILINFIKSLERKCAKLVTNFLFSNNICTIFSFYPSFTTLWAINKKQNLLFFFLIKSMKMK